MNQIAAIPTRYGGVQFRSRLEARWAAFFDLVGWRWDYEPIDLEGYIPDFIITDMHSPLLVEVKPAYKVKELYEAEHKIQRTSWKGNFLLVGATVPLTYCPGHDYCWLGWGGSGWDGCMFLTKCSSGGYGINTTEGYWRCMRCGVEGKPSCGRNEEDEAEHLIMPIWREAGNRVQWKPA